MSGQAGFILDPIWNWYGNETIALDPENGILSPWLLSHALDYDLATGADPNGGDFPLLLDYALNLDPGLDQSGALPNGALGEDVFIDYYAGASGITYSVEHSNDLVMEETGVSVETIESIDADALCRLRVLKELSAPEGRGNAHSVRASAV